MAHYSEMDFLFDSETNRNSITQQLNNTSVGNTHSIFNSKYTVYKKNDKSVLVAGTNKIKAYTQENIYNNENNSINPYVKILKDPTFNTLAPKPGAGLRLKPSYFAYLRDLGVYPINRMAILRRYPEGVFVPENLGLMNAEPVSTIIGWIKQDDNFGTINFNETWGITNKRFDEKIADIVKKVTKVDIANIIPIPSFAQGMLFEIYKKMGLTGAGVNEEADNGSPNYWGLNNIPIGDPNVLKEGPFRDPETQNIKSSFSFELITVYEQKLVGEVDPGSAMLDILDNIYAMGTSNMSFYWSDSSKIMQKAKGAVDKRGNNLSEWWDLVVTITESFWETLKTLFTEFTTEATVAAKTLLTTESTKDKKTQAENEAATKKSQENRAKYVGWKDNASSNRNKYKKGTPDYLKWDKKYNDDVEAIKKIDNEGKTDPLSAAKQSVETNSATAKVAASSLLTKIVGEGLKIIQKILTSTVAIHRFELRGSIELMTGGQDSAAPWHLTIGNPYSPWLNTSHIIVKTCSVETSNEMGFNDMPQRLTAKFQCEFSRSLGKQELMRMFNNTYRREYSSIPTTPIQYQGEVKPEADKIYDGGSLPEIVVTPDTNMPGNTSVLDPSIENYMHSKDGNWYTYKQRKAMAAKAGIQNYRGTAEQNTQWLDSLRAQDNANGFVDKVQSNDNIT